MNRAPSRNAAVAACCLAALGCGQQAHPSSARDSGGVFSTSVDGTKTLGNLSTAEQGAFCRDISAYVASTVIPASCRFAAVGVAYQTAEADATATDEALQTACTNEFSSCSAAADGGTSVPLSGGVSQGGSDAGASSSSSLCGVAITAGCQATVNEYVSCLNGDVVQYDALPSCNGVTRSILSSLAADGGFMLRQAPACQSVRDCTSGAG